MRQSKRSLAILTVALLSALFCGAERADRPKTPPLPPPVLVPQVFQTQDWQGSDVDSVAVWRDPDGGALLFVTAKQAHRVYVCDGLTGAFVRALGGQGRDLGRFNRPNGIAVMDNYLFVAERDGRRVQVFEIPSLQPILAFGSDILILPYSMAIFRSDGNIGNYDIYVTDNYSLSEKAKSAPRDFGARVKHFKIKRSGDRLGAQLVRSFGKGPPNGALRRVESILADPANNRLFVCDEEANDVEIYDLSGRYAGRSFGRGVIRYEAEGLVLFEDSAAPSGGWLVIADQGSRETALRIFTRDGSRYIGAVTGTPPLANTDGIALSQGDFGPFKRGALYCVHDDIRVQAYSWADIEAAMQLRERAR